MKKIFLTLFSFAFSIALFAQSTCLPDGIGFTNQSEIDAFATNYPGCTCIQGDVDIYGKNIMSLAGLSQITEIKGDLRISYLSAPDFTGLDNLTNIDGHLAVFGGRNTSTVGLEGLARVGKYVSLTFNQVENLDGLINLKRVGLGIYLRDNDQLVSLDGLSTICYTASAIWICDNDVLSDISGLDAIIENDKVMSIRIKNNPNLPICEVTPVCDFLDRGGEAEITGNAEGCNSQEELCCTLVEVTDEVFVYSDMDKFVYPIGITTTLEVPMFPSDATCNDIVMVGYFRVVGASCESDIEVEITDPAGNPIFMGNIFATCNGSGSSHPIGALYSVSLPIPMAIDVEPGDWTVKFTDSNRQNPSGPEYLVGFVSLVADCAYEICENDLEDRSDEVLEIKEVLLYPVPANQQLNVDYYTEQTRLVMYEVFSADGKPALLGEEFVVRGKNTFQVNVASLPAGQYYIRMNENDSELIQTKPFVKM